MRPFTKIIATSVLLSAPFQLTHGTETKAYERENGSPLSRFPQPEENTLSLLSYNVCAGGKGFEAFDTRINFTEDLRHTWATRAPYMKEFLSTHGKTDLQSFQELSSQQILDIASFLGDKTNFIVLSSHPSDVEAGTIRNTREHAEEIKSWRDKNVGTMLTGIAYNTTKFIPETSVCFWLNEDPWTIPTDKSPRETDKGFGNTNTSRAVLGIKFKHHASDKSFYLFNSHYPLSGGAAARVGCATTKMREIEKITQGLPWFATGDRNMIGTDEESQIVYQAFFQDNPDVQDYRDVHHYGQGVNWIGFSTDKFKNLPNPDLTFSNSKILCATFFSEGKDHSLKVLRSAHFLGEFDLQKGQLKEISDVLTDPEQRTTIPDHAAILVHFTL